MGKLTLSQATLNRLVEVVKGSITVAVGATITGDVSSAKLEDPDNGVSDLAENGFLAGHGQSEFTYSTGMTVKVDWTFVVDGVKIHIIIHREEAIQSKQ